MNNVHFRYLISALSVIGGTILAFNGVTGWGWFLFVAVIMGDC